jgi:thiol-disulfide isomerase/thioredoxin
MKTKSIIAGAMLSLCLMTGCAHNRGTIDYPVVVARNNTVLEIAQIEVSDTATVLHINAFYDPGNWIKIDPKSFLADDRGKSYPLRWAEGIVPGKEFYLPASGETAFTLYFPPVASRATYVDFSEGDYPGAFKIWGIRLTEQAVKLRLNQEIKKVVIDSAAVLPPVDRQAGKAHFEGQILGYRSGMPNEVSVQVAYPFLYPPTEMVLPVDAKGNFSGEIDVFSTHPAWVRWTGNAAHFFLAAGRNTTVVLNPVADSRPTSDALGEPAYFGGYLASLAKELAGLRSVFSIDARNDADSYYAFLESIENETPESLKVMFLNEYWEKKAVLDTLPASPAAKQVLACGVDLAYANDVLSTLQWLERARIYRSQQPNDSPANAKTSTFRDYPLPDNFYDALKDFAFLNDSTLLYLPELGGYARQWQLGQAQPLLSRLLGTDGGPLFDVMKTTEAYASIADFTPVDEATLRQLPDAYRPFIETKNNELLQLITANESKTDYSVNDVEKLSPDAVMPYILSKFRGKPILIDFWATWCGPCRVANEELKPVKAALAGEDLVYVFITGESSPPATWTQMIPDLHGEHFRLTEEQWNYIGEYYHLRAVPTYFFIDRKGNLKDQQAGYPGVATMKKKIHQLIGK